MSKILIISAMPDVELNYLIENLDQEKIEYTNLCTFYLGKIYQNEIILCAAKIGLIQTAAAITLAIEKYKPDYIINQGCSGASNKKIYKSDIVVGIECINITSFKTKYQKEGQGYSLDDWELYNYIAGRKDGLVPQKANDKLIEKVKKIENSYKQGKIYYGRIGSGDTWNKQCDWIINLNKKYNILCEDMEGIAVYTIANQYKIPAIDMRVISNNELLNEEYDVHTNLYIQKFTMNLLREIF